MRDGLPPAPIRALLMGRDGTLWIGTDGGGLARLKDGAVTVLTRREGLTTDDLVALHQDETGALWIGTTYGGLNRWKDGKLASVTTRQGLFDDTAFSVVEDSSGHLWMTGNRGLSRVARHELEEVMEGRRAKVRPSVYGLGDGMKSAECSGGTQPAGWRGRDGRLYFPTIRGLVVVDPSRLAPSAFRPNVLVEEVVADGRSLAAGAARLAPGTSAVEVHYTALGLRSPDRVRFRYRLEGFERDWVEAGTRRVAYYTNLPHGEYRFRVAGSNEDGLFGEAPATLSLSVAPRLHERAPVRIAGLLLFCAALFAGYRLRIWRLKARERQLVALVDERTRELRQALAVAEEHEREARAASRAKSVFLAAMSHELRTPLNAVLGFSELLERDPSIGGESRDGLGIIRRSGTHLLGLINDVLSISRIEAGRLTLLEEPFDLRELLEAVRAMVRVRAETKGIDVVFHLDPGLPRGVRGDAGKLRQVLLNILGNAVKFTERGQVLLRASWTSGRARFEVEDTGPGIAPGERQRLFEAFVQTETGRSSGEGTGLGLAISRQIVRMMDGDITVESEPGIGSTFRVEVALPEAALVEAAPEGDVASLAEGVPSPRVLVVDDTEENRLLVSRILGGAGFTVREAAGGAEALEVWAAFRPQAVLMDMRMPVMDGAEATRRIRALEEGTGTRTRIVALTASVLDDEHGQILSAGADDVMRKPFRVDELFAVLGRLLDLRYRRAPRAVPRHASEAPAVPPEHLPGFDLEGGRRRASGDRALHERLVAGFARDLGDTIARLRGLLTAGDTREAMRVLHTLKGTAATLGARRLAGAAATLEARLRDGDARAPEPLDQLETAVEEVRGSAAGLTATRAGTDAGSAAAPLAPDRLRSARELAARLGALLREGSLDAVECAAELRQALEPAVPEGLAELEAAVARLDEGAALAALAGLEARLAEDTPPPDPLP